MLDNLIRLKPAAVALARGTCVGIAIHILYPEDNASAQSFY